MKNFMQIHQPLGKEKLKQTSNFIRGNAIKVSLPILIFPSSYKCKGEKKRRQEGRKEV